MKAKQILLALLALALCVPAAAEQSEIALVPAGAFTGAAGFEDDCARVIDRGEDGLYDVFDIAGEALIPCEYGDISEYGVCSFYTVQNESGVNRLGALDADGNLVMPMEYGDIEFLSESWGMGVKLEETDGEPYDYQAFFGDENYIVTAYDFYDLTTGERAGTLERAACANARAYGDYLWVEDRAGKIVAYDRGMTVVNEQVDSFYDAYASSQEGVISVATGEVIASGYRYAADLGCGLLAVSGEDYQKGVVDLEGNLVAPCEYDSIYEYKINGYARVEIDGKYGLIDLAGNLVVPCEYDGIESFAFAGGYANAVDGYACVEIGDKYGYVRLGGEVTCPVNYAAPTIIGLSMIVPDIDGSLYIIAADGTRTKTEYAEFAPYPGGYGRLLQAKNAQGKWGLVDWHGNVLMEFVYDYRSAVEIAPDGSVVLAETDEGKTAYIVSSAA